MSDDESDVVEEAPVDEPTLDDAESVNSVLAEELGEADEAGDAENELEEGIEKAEENEEELPIEEEEEAPPPPESQNQFHKRIIVVAPEKRRTSNRVCQTELTELIGIRAEQIAAIGTTFVDIDTTNKGSGHLVTDPVVMAKMEIRQRRCPLILRRTQKTAVDKATGQTTQWVEDWDPNQMILPKVVV